MKVLESCSSVTASAPEEWVYAGRYGWYPTYTVTQIPTCTTHVTDLYDIPPSLFSYVCQQDPGTDTALT